MISTVFEIGLKLRLLPRDEEEEEEDREEERNRREVILNDPIPSSFMDSMSFNDRSVSYM